MCFIRAAGVESDRVEAAAAVTAVAAAAVLALHDLGVDVSSLQDTWRQEEGGTGRDVSNAKYKAGEEGFTVIHCPAEPSRGSPSRDTPAQRSALARDAMPAVSVTIDKGLGLDATAVAKVAHDAVKNGIGKPDQCAPPPLDSHRCVAMLSRDSPRVRRHHGLRRPG